MLKRDVTEVTYLLSWACVLYGTAVLLLEVGGVL
jgi:hypothetical protein